MIEIRTADDPASLAAARMLVRAHIVELSAVQDEIATERVVSALPEPYGAPRGALWVAWDGDAAVGCLALQELAPDTAELKRMYVAPEARGRGVARRLAEHAIAAAAPPIWRFCRSFSLDYARTHARRGNHLGAVAQAAKAVMEQAHAIMCERGRWVCNEKGLIEAAGLNAMQPLFAHLPDEPGALLPWVDRVADVLQVPNDEVTPWRVNTT